MASTSASSVQKSFKYDVFLSFRGEDVRKTFVDHLYLALVNKCIITYKDDEKIDKGERINEQLIRSIKDSRFYLIVFSKNYASSSWCLDELVEIMECQKMTEHTAYPIFFDVEPTEVRHQSGAVGKAFAKHVGKEGADRWRDALREAADLAGWELKNTVDGHEAKFIQRIVQDILLKPHFINSRVYEKLVGMETRIKNVVSSLNMDCDDVRIIGIKGIGGGGKTTLARAVFDYISVWFEGKSFIENVREVSNSSSSGLKKLQKQVLKDVLNDDRIHVANVFDGKSMMKRMLCSRKVLLVLDDVDETKQLEALAGEPSWFKPGSRIIITTRDAQVLKAHQVNFIHQGNFIHDVSLLSHEEAICLFHRYAFGREIPKQGYEYLSRKVVDYADGLPLTLKTLGSHLCGRSELEWEDAIKRLETIPFKEILDILELSYNGLEDDQKEIFLDIACILHGLSKKKVIRMLAGCGYHAQIGLSVLEQKSLITIGKSDNLIQDVDFEDGFYDVERVLMHDHIKELGMNIVRRLHPHEPKRHSRLWIKEEIEVVLVNDSVNEEIKCIRLYDSNIDPAIIEKGHGKMKELRLLCVEYVYSEYEVDEFSHYLPDSLQSLDWRYYPFYCLPTTFQAKKLVNLELVDSNISEFWEGGEIKVLNKLKFLNLRGSKVRTFDLTLTPHLEELNLGGCRNFVELQFSVECMNLKFLNLSYSKVSNLNLGMTPHLEHLDLTGCNDLLELQLPVKCSNFKFLLLEHSKVSNLNLLMTRHLEKLTLGAPGHFVEFHLPVECPILKSLSINGAKKGNLNLGMTPHLEELYLHACDEFELHMAVECSKLKYLELEGSKVSSLDLGLTPNLERLYLNSCNYLHKIRAPNLELHMAVECSKLKYLRLEGSKVSKLDLGLTPNLERLDLTRCNYLHKIHAPVGCLKRLVCYDLTECSAFQYFEFEKKVHESTDLGSVATYIITASCVCICPMHPECNLPRRFYFRCKYDEPGSSWSGNLEKLISSGFVVCACKNIEYLSATICGLQHLRELTLEGSIPRDLCKLEILEKLSLQDEKIQHLPGNIFMLKHPKSLQVECSDLKRLPKKIWRSGCLEELYISSCKSLRGIPNNICKMKCLKRLHITFCDRLEELPEEIGCLECLEELKVTFCHSLRDIPDSICKIKSLKLLALSHCSIVKELPEEIGCLECLEELDLGFCKTLQEIPKSIGKMKSLKLLNLRNCLIVEELPEEIGCLECLEELDLDNCRSLRYIPKSICKMKSLKLLDLQSCLIVKELPEELGCLECLEELVLEGCDSLRDIPKSICKMKSLKLLNLENCLIVELPEELGCLECLEELNLRNCSSLREIPKSICKMKSLELLNLENCLIVEELPEELGCLECLEKLNLGNCRSLREIPKSICKMKSLKLLNLENCLKVEELPEELGCLECLEELNLGNCRSLREIPKSICNMKSLQRLNLENCLIVEELPEELGRLKCLKELRIEDSSHLPQSIYQLKFLRIVRIRRFM